MTVDNVGCYFDVILSIDIDIGPTVTRAMWRWCRHATVILTSCLSADMPAHVLGEGRPTMTVVWCKPKGNIINFFICSEHVVNTVVIIRRTRRLGLILKVLLSCCFYEKVIARVHLVHLINERRNWQCMKLYSAAKITYPVISKLKK